MQKYRYIRNPTACHNYLKKFVFCESSPQKNTAPQTHIEIFSLAGQEYHKFINEFWTAKQRQGSSLHEISYRACFKSQLPEFFIRRFSKVHDRVYDPFGGRGTSIIEAALLKRQVALNDINPLSHILCKARLSPPDLAALSERLEQIPLVPNLKADIDLSMFYHPATEAELVSLQSYLAQRKAEQTEDSLDSWIRMLATNRLTGHSTGFFSVYTLPPNQAISALRQIKINQSRGQIPPYRNVKHLILKKSKSLLRDIDDRVRKNLKKIASQAIFTSHDAASTPELQDESIQLTITSPPFLDIVQYAEDNWLRCWFNGIDAREVGQGITMSKTLSEWSEVMTAVFKELFRITKRGGWLAFEVGEVKNGQIHLENAVLPLGIAAGFECCGILINQQCFTKTSNIWGIRNNNKGTNSNRIVLFYKN